jgi:error-prone DNA polymerase
MGWDNPPISWREFERRLSWHSTPDDPEPASPATGDPPGSTPPEPDPPPEPAPSQPPGSRERSERDVTAPGPASGSERDVTTPWVELHCHSSYSFLDGASDPGDLVAEARRLDVEALALTDHDGMYGVVRFTQAVAMDAVAHPDRQPIGTIFGAELSLGLSGPQNGIPDPEGTHLLVVARDPEGYRRLCRVISAAQLAGGEKGRPVYDPAMLAQEHGDRWLVLTGCRKGAVPRALADRGPEAAEVELRALTEMFGRDNVQVELIDHDQPLDDARNDALFELARRVGVGTVASNNVHYAAPGTEAQLATALAAVRARRSLDEMVGWLPATGTAHLRSGAEMAARLARFPGVLEHTVELGRACVFDFDVMAPELPAWEVPDGHTEASYLRQLVAQGARRRYGPRGAPGTEKAYAQLDHELGVIEHLGFPGYFLIVHDIVAFCQRENILCQGRGSAANSAVCYALGITSVDAVRHDLLFERFLSPGRDGPPDIDLDIEHRRREEAIQYVYDKYGRKQAAQVANVISYRPKMALRDAAKAMGHSPGQQDAWSRQVRLGDPIPEEVGIPDQVVELAEGFLRLPRHLGIHSGGMVICDRPVGEVCPVEWARMPNRSVLQWDKDDCAAAGLVKFDLLGLGMLAALHDSFDLIADHHGVVLTLDSIPDEDRQVYDMLCDADTVGVFQVESRAQMATLPRLRPREFYDLVVEVALIRPGPIQGGSVHPYLRRRSGAELTTYPHPLMEQALRRTLGVPLFQEQMMQIAVDCAGFTPQEADKLRQAMSSKRAPERIGELRTRLLTGMADRDIPADVAEQIYDKVLGFASFGFPESHAISFAYLVCASAYLKRYYPAAFTVALLRNQPMGFYSPQTLVADARRHGVTVRGVDVNVSDALATLEEPLPLTEEGAAHPHAPNAKQPAIRLGLAAVRNVGKQVAEAIAAGRPYASLEDLVRRVRPPTPALEALATAGALGCFGLDRREALWIAGAVAQARPDQLPGTTPGTMSPALPAMTPVEETFADLWATGTSPASHPVQHVRVELEERGAVPTGKLAAVQDGTQVLVGGIVTHRQRPPTAGGVVFLNLEDETGMVNVLCPPGVWARWRQIGLQSAALVVRGRLERTDGATNLLANKLERLRITAPVHSRDFR